MLRSEALQLGADLWRSDIGKEGIPLLVRTGLYNHMEVAQILDLPQLTVYREMKDEQVPKYTFNQALNVTTLDSLMVIAKMHEDGRGVPGGLVNLCVEHGTALVTIERLTGVSKNDLQEALSVFGGGADTETV